MELQLQQAVEQAAAVREDLQRREREAEARLHEHAHAQETALATLQEELRRAKEEMKRERMEWQAEKRAREEEQQRVHQEEQAKNDAAILVQAMARRANARTHAASLRALGIARESQAACCVQCAVRQRQAWRLVFILQRRCRAAIQLQCASRQRKARRRCSRLRGFRRRGIAAVRLQAAARMRLAVSRVGQVRNRGRAATTIQSLVRRVVGVRAASVRSTSIVTIQAWVRGETLRYYMAMQETGALCVEVRKAKELEGSAFLKRVSSSTICFAC
jgi:hypothetical protein